MSTTAAIAINSPRIQSLLVILSIIAGSTDAIGFLGLSGLFTAHITGNLAILASRIVVHNDAQLSSILSVPVYMSAVCVTKMLADNLDSTGKTLLSTLTLLQLFLLGSFMALCLVQPPSQDPNGGLVLLAGMLGVCAMAVQNVLVQVAFKGAPPTAIMTSNVTRFSISIGSLICSSTDETKQEARAQIAHTLPAILGFTFGCAAGAAGESVFGMRALALPVALAVVACLMSATASRPS
jgi:uncharacterized membrane protein YoaK (UPF0700 family)